jgi:hypothetical protein
MKITLRITFLDGTSRNVLVSAADMVAFENEYDISIAKLDEARIGWLLYLAWHSEKRRKATDKPYDTWIDDVETIGADDDPKATASKA